MNSACLNTDVFVFQRMDALLDALLQDASKGSEEASETSELSSLRKGSLSDTDKPSSTPGLDDVDCSCFSETSGKRRKQTVTPNGCLEDIKAMKRDLLALCFCPICRETTRYIAQWAHRLHTYCVTCIQAHFRSFLLATSQDSRRRLFEQKNRRCVCGDGPKLKSVANSKRKTREWSHQYFIMISDSR